MPVKHLITPGIGFSPGSVQYIITRGLSAAPNEAGSIEVFHSAKRGQVFTALRGMPTFHGTKRGTVFTARRP